MSRVMKKQYSASANSRFQNGNKKANLAKKNGVHKPNAANVKKAILQKGQQQQKQNQKKRQNQQQQKLQQKPLKKPMKVEPESEEDEDDEEVNDGVKMFKGLPKEKKLPSKNIKVEDEDDEESDDDDEDEDLDDEEVDDEDLDDEEMSEDDEDDDEDEEEDEDLKPKKKDLQLGDLLGESLAEDDDDDEFESEDEEDDDDDEEDEEVGDDDEEDEESDDDEEDDEEPTPKKKKLEIKDLLGKTISEDEDDDDFEAEDDDDEEDEDIDEEDEDEEVEKAPKKVKVEKEKKKEKPEMMQQKLERTIYVGNVPKEMSTNKIEKLFKKFGEIESVRIRNAVPEKLSMSKKTAVILKKLHPKVDHVSAFVVFKEEEAANKALAMNGVKVEGNILSVNSAAKKTFDPKKAVFLGNLPFDVKFNDVYEKFAKCGEIESLRIIRDKRTGLSRGFGYVNYDSEDAVALALELHGTKIGEREIRVQNCTANASGKRKHNAVQGKKQHKKGPFKPKTHKSPNQSLEKSESEAETNGKTSPKKKKNKPFKKDESEMKSSPKKQPKLEFVGEKSDKKKKNKNKPNKEQKEKQVLAKKLMKKSKKE